MTDRSDGVRPLCRDCAKLFPEEHDSHDDDGPSRSCTFAELSEEAARSDCPLCAIIQQQLCAAHAARKMYEGLTPCDIQHGKVKLVIDHSSTGDQRDRDAAEHGNLERVGWFTLRGSLDVGGGVMQKIWMLLTLVYCEARDSHINPAIWTVPGPTTTITQKHATVQRWLAACDNEHPGCSQASVGPLRILPTRLIALDHVDGVNRARLVRTVADFHGGIKYAALSHCWGGRVPLRTVQANLSFHAHEIPLHGIEKEGDIPRTFQDAIALCLSLGIAYLWIDSLCIVQDDLAEWQVEAGRMKDVYANATLTIAASNARSSADGCFQFQPSVPESDDRHFSLWSPEILRFSATVQHGEDNSCTSPDTSRVILLHWQCCEAFKTEAGVELTDDLNQPYTRIMAQSRFRNDLTEGEEGDESYDFDFDDWTRWMVEYSCRQFTKPSDRLPALAGIVQSVAERTGYSHLLGCWKETLCTDLAWFGTGSQETHSIVPGIPSWSWMSQGDEGSWMYFSRGRNAAARFEDHVRLLNADIVWEGASLVTKLQRAHLVVEGSVKDLQLTAVSEAANWFRPVRFSVQDNISTWRTDSASLQTTKILESGSLRRGECTFLVLGRVVDGTDDCEVLVQEPQSYCRVGIMLGLSWPHFQDAEGRVIKLI
ncbi:heterokaryon incompatibility protein-domain-containing protein [Microdochium bolleyi]|uniref:Heterokaryon incompatibility protein-domain-containing protein n=1 Tax=Microdochium bolleyi TaxID=196109 RepID=A0A136IKI8_9PEZI|nr:heterokaryon incompatibility protein-domain-containing protein [Microdochium bolleyi]